MTIITKGTIAGAPVVSGTCMQFYLNVSYTTSITSTATAVPMLWDTVSVPGNYVTYVAATGVLTFTAAGHYSVNLNSHLGTNNSTNIYAYLLVNGNTVLMGGAMTSANSGGYGGANVSTWVYGDILVPAGATGTMQIVGQTGSPYSATVFGSASGGSLSSITYRGPY
jgi:hypothetical protein